MGSAAEMNKQKLLPNIGEREEGNTQEPGEGRYYLQWTVIRFHIRALSLWRENVFQLYALRQHPYKATNISAKNSFSKTAIKL